MRVLLVEDDTELSQQLHSALDDAGFAVDPVADGIEAEFRGQTEDYDAIVLDVGLPGMDGLSALHRWRETGRHTPVLILTARNRWHDKLSGFNAGADDYLTKPFHTEELIVRLRALIRRSVGFGSQEFRILEYLIHHAGRVVSRSELGEHVYDVGYDPDSNVLDVMIGRIRRKLGGHGLLQTRRGHGFVLQASV